MLSKSFLTLVLATVAVSAANITYTCPGGGKPQCCGQLHSPNSSDGTTLLTLVGESAQSQTGQVGAQCTTTTATGTTSAANCASSVVCCKKLFPNQLIGVGCTPATKKD